MCVLLFTAHTDLKTTTLLLLFESRLTRMPPKRFRYTEQHDLDLMDQVCVINPWGAGKTWDGVRETATASQPDFASLTAKGLYDRSKHLIIERKAKLAHELKA